MINYPGLEYQHITTWDNVFKAWQKREGTRQNWQQVAKDKGWDSWQQWRSNWVIPIDAKNREWHRFTILDPLKIIPDFRMGPSKSWQKNFPEDQHNKHTFATLVSQKPYDQNSKVQGILTNFPDATEFIGVYMPDQKITLIEGHHRATALSLLAQENKSLNFTNPPTIALTIFSPGEEKFIDHMLARGSAKEHN